VLRRGRDAGPILDGPELDEPEARQEVDEIRMVDDDLGAPQGLHLPGPPGHLLVEPSQERRAVALEGGAMLRGHAQQPVEDVLRDDRRQPRIEREVWVAERVDVAHRAIDARARHLQQRHPPRDLDTPAAAAHDVGVVGVLHGHVHPGVELGAVLDEQVGLAQLEHHARPHLGFVEVLGPSRERLDVDEIATHRLGEGFEIGDRGDDPDLVGGGAHADHADHEDRDQDGTDETGHGILLRTGAPDGRPG
jgi:hypothetical protein